MRNLSLIFFVSLLSLPFIKADCTFESFAVGEEFAIGNMLQWVTSTEVDNQHFVVERSIDGITYDVIGEVKGSGTSSDEQEYRFLDLDARKGRSFYRLKQVDFDEDFSYSKIVIVDKTTNNNFMISGMNNNQNNEMVELTIDAVEEMEITCSIKDMKGDLLEEHKSYAKMGLNNITFNLTSYPNGSYRLFLESGDESEMITIRKTISSEEIKLPVANKE